jgi:hypothetical protein
MPANGRWDLIQRLKVNLAPIELGKCQIVRNSGLSDHTCTDLSSQRLYFVNAHIVGLCNQSQHYSIWISPSYAGSDSAALYCVLKSLELNKLTEQETTVWDIHNSQSTDTFGGCS